MGESAVRKKKIQLLTTAPTNVLGMNVGIILRWFGGTRSILVVLGLSVTTIGFLSFAATILLISMRASVPTRIGRHLIKLMRLRWWTGTWNRLDVAG
ncbi:pathogenesis-related protein-1-like protein [Prunus dulcis]|uniref:Pathogenesis-related protein-1-like protein n=1 Tax=Prunus dulcis TaxID=3755 RepID=A0A4Y1QTN3_PRUDU|nr:pathogenesis-related protein-1-like protein [Prunus dulcis]